MAFPRNIVTPAQVISSTFESVAAKSLPLIIIGKAAALPGEVRRPVRESRVWIVMRKITSDPAGMDVRLSSPAPASMPSGYHKILKPVKGCRATPPSWGSMRCNKNVEKTKGKLGGESRRV